MTWISDNKDAGPWDFTKQPDKLHYNEGNLISDHDDPIWATDHLSLFDEPVTPTHYPWCGYWHKGYPPKPPSLDCNCVGITIGYTTLQMSCVGEQTLNVENPVAGCIYNWVIASGGGSLSSNTGASIVYTAPSSNPYCSNNPTIELSCGDVCDSITIAVNCWTHGFAYEIRSSDCYKNAHWHLRKFNYTCDGILYDYLWCSAPSYAECVITCEPGKFTDLRTPEAKAGGCCPEALM